MKKILIAVLLFHFSCAVSNTQNTVLSDNIENNSIHKLLVIVLNKTENNKGLIEKEVAYTLRNKGYEAIAYSEADPVFAGIPNDESAKKVIANHNCDGALVIRLINVEEGKKFSYNERYEGFYNYLDAFKSNNDYGYFQLERTLVFQCNLYDLESKNMIYAIKSETYLAQDIEATAGDFSQSVVSDLQKTKVLQK